MWQCVIKLGNPKWKKGGFPNAAKYSAKEKEAANSGVTPKLGEGKSRCGEFP